MEFLKNLKGEFIYRGNICDFLKNHMLYKTWKDEDLKVSIVNMNMESITFSLVDYDANDFVSSIIEQLLVKLKENFETSKSINLKIMDAWNNNPDSFVKYTEGREWRHHFKNETLLTEDEYCEDTICVFFEKYTAFYNSGHMSGLGSFTYEPKEVTQKWLDGVDEWYDKEVKNLKSDKLRTRFINFFNNLKIELSIKDVIKKVTILNTV
jgi:hypothetical protein